jgi:iron-sulfur cluster assembly protein
MMTMSTERVGAEAPGFKAVEKLDTGVSKKTIAVSPAAVEAIRRHMEKRGTPGAALRIGIRGGGCSGFSYSIEFDDAPPRKGDLVLEFDAPGPPGAESPAGGVEGAGPHGNEADKAQVRVFCDKKSILYLGGSVLDFEKTLMSQGFKFRNPQEATRCGCGHSFTVA